jgi:uncharacterized membrane protein
MSSATKQKSSAGKNVLIFFIVFIILEMLIVVGVGRVFKNKNVTPSIAGYSLYIMNGDGMGDRVPNGALVITSNMTPSTDKIGEAVVCENVPDIGTSVFWLYDITSTDDNNGVVYTVYQEKDPAKLYEISSKNVVGVASTYYMTAGKVLTFMSSTFGMIVCAVVPIFLLVVIELIIAIATHSSDDEEEDEQEPAESVTLDDFLFGGENEGEQIAKHRKHVDDEIASHHKAEPEGEEKAETEEVIEEVEEVEETIFERPAEKEERAEIDRSYYERASQLLDEAASTEDTVAPEPEKKPVPKAKPAAKPAQQTKTASASLEELMKLMEQEQEKLKKQLDKK